MTQRILWSCTFAALLVASAVPAHSGGSAACIPGVYLVRESSGTQSLWTFSSDGTLHSTSSAQGALGFGDAHGEWKRGRDQQVRSTFLDFTYSPSSVGSGFPPASVARVDADMSFSRR